MIRILKEAETNRGEIFAREDPKPGHRHHSAPRLH